MTTPNFFFFFFFLSLNMKLTLLLLLGLVGLVLGGIYPEGHFDASVQLNSDDDYNKLVSEAVNGDHTLFVRWIASEG